jgi:hypothetical protein
LSVRGDLIAEPESKCEFLEHRWNRLHGDRVIYLSYNFECLQRKISKKISCTSFPGLAETPTRHENAVD